MAPRLMLALPPSLEKVVPRLWLPYTFNRLMPGWQCLGECPLPPNQVRG